MKVKGWPDMLRTRKILSRNTVVLIDSFGVYAIKGLLLSLALRIPLVLRLRGEYFREEAERRCNKNIFGKAKSSLGVALAKVTLRRCRKVICNSKYLAEKMQPFLRGTPVSVVFNPYTELPLSQTAEQLRLPDGGFHLLTVTNMHLRSKIAPVFEFIQTLDAELFKSNKLYWVICGEGYYYMKLKQLVKDKCLDKNIIVYKYINDVRALYTWADVMVHLTRMDAFPNCTMEAMMHGLPVITNPDSCGTVELVEDNTNGLIGNDVMCLIEKYMSDEALISKHASQGKKIVESKFSVPVQRAEMIKALNTVDSSCQ